MGLIPEPMLTRRRFAASTLALAGSTVLPLSARAAESGEDARLMALFREIGGKEDALDPLTGIYKGQAPNIAAFRLLYSGAQVRARRSVVHAALAGLKRIDRRKLSADRQISYDVFLTDQRRSEAMLRPDMLALTEVRPFTHFGGLHIDFPSIVAKGGPLPYANEADYRSALALITAFPQVLDNAIARFREGMDSGVVESKLTVRNMIAQIDNLLDQPPVDSPFASATRDFPAAVPQQRRGEFAQRYHIAITDQVYPAYRRLRAFLNDEYLPAAREQVGISAMKGGTTYYRQAIQNHTTLRLEPEAIHQLGLAEVRRIQTEMDKVKTALGFAGSLGAFFEDVRTNPRYHPKTRDELAQGFAKVAREVDALVPTYFNHVPRTRLLIQPYPEYREKYEAGGSYNQGSPDGSRPGVFFYNAYDLPSRFLTGVATLYLHEGAPGHHFQISLAQEDTSLPDFQRFGGNNAYVEGWALYAETLGYDMGLFKDPMQHWGTLDDEMLRAMRLVVDTGLHAKGWTREQAIDFMLGNSGMGKSDATAEVERYIVWPGQALGYKIGALTIQRLKQKARDALGTRFDIRAFHDQILGSGALPMPVLEAKIDRWIAATKATS
ncbi:DUF885 domain-containing protein [Novosphingobium sp.]|uniref:DUF885 domain-containing protein n=1 Tax=Novosphingobium sp. TaxID=1874826 RepID=UPI0025E3B8E9|nr:DUF885 domain-containing protein [Novosphingobium sp.]